MKSHSKYISQFKHCSDNNGNIVFNTNCENILPTIPDESIDVILTDPPYNIGYADWDKWFNVMYISNQWYRILKPTGSVFCFTGWSFVCELLQKFDKRFTLNDWIIYDRIKGRGGLKRMVSTRENLLWFVKSKNWVFNKEMAYGTIKKKTGGLGLKNGRDVRALSNVWTDISPIVPWSKERTGHPTQKPLQLGKRILDVFSKPGSVVLDCYAGSGTFLQAAKENNSYFIGIEKSEDYFNMIINRIF